MDVGSVAVYLRLGVATLASWAGVRPK